MMKFSANKITSGFSAAGYTVVDPSRVNLTRATWTLAVIDAGKLPVDLSIADADLLIAASLQT